MDYIFNDSKNSEAVTLLIEEYLKFSDRNNSPWLTYTVLNQPALLKHLGRLAEKLGLNVIQEPYVPFIARRTNEDNNADSN